MMIFTNSQIIKVSLQRARFGRAWGAILVSGLMGIGGAAFAQEPLSLVPSIGVASTPSVAPREREVVPVATPAAPQAESRKRSSVSWNGVGTSQRVPVSRASFNQNGYYLSSTTAGTINIPFANRDIHVMKFAVSPDETTFFVNDGTAPVLYLPRNGYLYNNTVSGARWYPFSDRFCPVQPVFLGIAPNYGEFIQVGWYPNTITYGGYYGVTAYTDGGIFQPTSGLTFYIGTQSFGGWSPYRDFVASFRAGNNRPRVPVPVYSNNPNYNGYGTGGYRYYNDGYGSVNNGTTYPAGGGFGFPGGGFGYPGGGASSGGTPAPAQKPAPLFNRPGPTFDRVGPRFDNGIGFGFGYPRRY